MAESLHALLPVVLIFSAVATGYLSVLVAVHYVPTLPAEERFSVEIGAAVMMVVAIGAAFASGKVW